MPARRKPTNIKKLQGTLRPHRENENEVTYTQMTELPGVPDHWPDRQKEVFLLCASELRKVNLLHRTDLDLLSKYARSIYTAEKAEAKLDAEGHVTTMTNKGGHSYDVVSPWWKIWKEAVAEIHKGAAKFGFNPVDKTKIAISPSKKEKSDPFDDI